MCISTTSAPQAAATAAEAGSACNADTSFSMAAPASTATRITPAFMVSMDSGHDVVLDFEATGEAQGAFDHIAFMEGI